MGPSAGQALAVALYSNLAAVFLMEGRGCGRTRDNSVAEEWERAFTSADSALAIDPNHVKALYRRALARLEDEREGLPEAKLHAAVEDLEGAVEKEPHNKQISGELARIKRRVAALEETRRLKTPAEIVQRINAAYLERGGNCQSKHGYVWGQTDTFVHIFVPARGVRMRASGGEKVECAIRVGSVRIVVPSVAADGNAEQVQFELTGKLHMECTPDDSGWELEDDGLVIHVELAKRKNVMEEGKEKHWLCAFEGHPHTAAPHPDLQKHVDGLQRAAEKEEKEEKSKPKDPEKERKKEETLNRMREMFPDVPIEWGDTSLAGLEAGCISGSMPMPPK